MIYYSGEVECLIAFCFAGSVFSEDESSFGERKASFVCVCFEF